MASPELEAVAQSMFAAREAPPRSLEESRAGADGFSANFPPPELDHIQFLCAVDGSRWVKEVRWKPRYSMRETIRAVKGEAF